MSQLSIKLNCSAIMLYIYCYAVNCSRIYVHEQTKEEIMGIGTWSKCKDPIMKLRSRKSPGPWKIKAVKIRNR